MLKDQVDSNDVNLVNYNLCRSGVLWAEIGVVFFFNFAWKENNTPHKTGTDTSYERTLNKNIIKNSQRNNHYFYQIESDRKSDRLPNLNDKGMCLARFQLMVDVPQYNK